MVAYKFEEMSFLTAKHDKNGLRRTLVPRAGPLHRVRATIRAGLQELFGHERDGTSERLLEARSSEADPANDETVSLPQVDRARQVQSHPVRSDPIFTGTDDENTATPEHRHVQLESRVTHDGRWDEALPWEAETRHRNACVVKHQKYLAEMRRHDPYEVEQHEFMAEQRRRDAQKAEQLRRNANRQVVVIGRVLSQPQSGQSIIPAHVLGQITWREDPEVCRLLAQVAQEGSSPGPIAHAAGQGDSIDIRHGDQAEGCVLIHTPSFPLGAAGHRNRLLPPLPGQSSGNLPDSNGAHRTRSNEAHTTVSVNGPPHLAARLSRPFNPEEEHYRPYHYRAFSPPPVTTRR
jgi:hypothetical protein